MQVDERQAAGSSVFNGHVYYFCSKACKEAFDRSPSDYAAPADAEDADRHRGGQELPPEIQDRPEQNRGYDAAVREGPPLDTGPASVDVGEIEGWKVEPR